MRNDKTAGMNHVQDIIADTTTTVRILTLYIQFLCDHVLPHIKISVKRHKSIITPRRGPERNNRSNGQLRIKHHPPTIERNQSAGSCGVVSRFCKLKNKTHSDYLMFVSEETLVMVEAK